MADTKKKKRKTGFLPIAQDIVRRTRTGDQFQRGRAVTERETFRGTLRKARTGKEPEIPVYRRGRTVKEKGRNLMRELGKFATGKPPSKYRPAARPARPRATAARATPTSRFKRGGAAEAAQEAAQERGVAHAPTRPTPKRKKRGISRLDELYEMGLISKEDRKREYRREEKRILGR